jgi:hypothetical protein
MSFYLVITNITPNVDVRSVFEKLNLGTIKSSYWYSYGNGFAICYSSLADNEFAKKFYDRLVYIKKNRYAGEYIDPIQVICGKNSDGTELYGDVHLTNTLPKPTPL